MNIKRNAGLKYFSKFKVVNFVHPLKHRHIPWTKNRRTRLYLPPALHSVPTDQLKHPSVLLVLNTQYLVLKASVFYKVYKRPEYLFCEAGNEPLLGFTAEYAERDAPIMKHLDASIGSKANKMFKDWFCCFHIIRRATPPPGFGQEVADCDACGRDQLTMSPSSMIRMASHTTTRLKLPQQK